MYIHGIYRSTWQYKEGKYTRFSKATYRITRYLQDMYWVLTK